jgi:hypothetical protein
MKHKEKTNTTEDKEKKIKPKKKISSPLSLLNAHNTWATKKTKEPLVFPPALGLFSLLIE